MNLAPKTRGYFSVEVLGLHANALDGLTPVEAVSLLRRSAADSCRQFSDLDRSGLGQLWLIEQIEQLAHPLVQQTKRLGWIREEEEGTQKRRMEAALTALLLSLKGRVPPFVAKIPLHVEHQVDADRLLQMTTCWLALHEIYCGLRFAERNLGTTDLPSSLEVIKHSGMLIGVYLDKLFTLLTKVNIPQHRQSVMNGFADMEANRIDFTDLHAGLSAEFGCELVSFHTLIQLERLGALNEGGEPHWLVSGPVEVLLQKLKVTQENIPQEIREFKGTPESLLESVFSRWENEATRLQECANNSDDFPSPAWLPMVLPLRTQRGDEVILATSAADFLMHRTNEMYLSGHLSPAAGNREAARIKKFQQRVSDRLAAYQAKLLMPDAEFVNGVESDECFTVGFNQRKSIGSVGIPARVGDIDLYVFNRAKKHLCVCEVKYHWAPDRLWGFRNEYEKLGPSGTAARQMQRKLDFVRTQLSGMKDPVSGDSCEDWSTSGIVLTNRAPISVWLAHNDLPGISLIGSPHATNFLCG